jgi:hypothetical protein
VRRSRRTSRSTPPRAQQQDRDHGGSDAQPNVSDGPAQDPRPMHHELRQAPGEGTAGRPNAARTARTTPMAAVMERRELERGR